MYLERLRKVTRDLVRVCFEKLCYVVDRYTYIIPLVLSIPVVVVAACLFYSTINSLDDMNAAIKSLPGVIQTEMAKTRETFREEASTNRQLHQATREEIQESLIQLELERRQLKIQLGAIEKKVDAKKNAGTALKKPEVVNKQDPAPTEQPKRKKFLGIF